MDAKKVLDIVNKKSKTRDTVALYLDTEVLKSFKEACGDAPHGRVIEQLMREFIESAKKGDKK